MGDGEGASSHPVVRPRLVEDMCVNYGGKKWCMLCTSGNGTVSAEGKLRRRDSRCALTP